MSIIESTLFDIFGLKIVPIQNLGVKLNCSLKLKKKNFTVVIAQSMRLISVIAN